MVGTTCIQKEYDSNINRFSSALFDKTIFKSDCQLKKVTLVYIQRDSSGKNIRRKPNEVVYH